MLIPNLGTFRMRKGKIHEKGHGCVFLRISAYLVNIRMLPTVPLHLLSRVFVNLGAKHNLKRPSSLQTIYLHNPLSTPFPTTQVQPNAEQHSEPRVPPLMPKHIKSVGRESSVKWPLLPKSSLEQKRTKSERQERGAGVESRTEGARRNEPLVRDPVGSLRKNGKERERFISAVTRAVCLVTCVRRDRAQGQRDKRGLVRGLKSGCSRMR